MGSSLRFKLKCYSAYIVLFIAVLIVGVRAQTSDFDLIISPGQDAIIAAGSTFDITWSSSSDYDGTVTLTLLGGSSAANLAEVEVIAKGIDNSADSYVWSVPDSLGSDAVYGLRISLDSDPDVFQYSFPFTIKASSGSAASQTPETTATSPKTTTTTSKTTTTTTTPDPTTTTTSTTTTPTKEATSDNEPTSSVASLASTTQSSSVASSSGASSSISSSQTSQTSSSSSPTTSSSPATTSHGGLSTGAKAGIGAGIAVAALLLLALGFLLWRRRRRTSRNAATADASSRSQPHSGYPELESGANKHELALTASPRREAPGPEEKAFIYEAPAGKEDKAEEYQHQHRAELSADEIKYAPVEMPVDYAQAHSRYGNVDADAPRSPTSQAGAGFAPAPEEYSTKEVGSYGSGVDVMQDDEIQRLEQEQARLDAEILERERLSELRNEREGVRRRLEEAKASAGRDRNS